MRRVLVVLTAPSVQRNVVAEAESRTENGKKEKDEEQCWNLHEPIIARVSDAFWPIVSASGQTAARPRYNRRVKERNRDRRTPRQGPTSEPNPTSEANPTVKPGRTSKPGRKRRLAGRSQSAAKRRARAGISLFFFTNGAIFAGMLPRLPEVKDALDLTNTEFGLLVILSPIGSLCPANLPAYFIRKMGALPSSLRWTAVLVSSVGLVGAAVELKSAFLFGACLFAAGASDSVVDTAQNSHAMRIQAFYGKTVINSLHALWSAGCVIGGLLGAGLAALGVPMWIHMVGASLALLCIAAAAVRLSQLPDDAAKRTRSEDSHANVAGRRFLALVPLALIGIAGIQIEVVGNDWSANYFAGPVGWSPADAGIAYVVMVSAQFIGRVLGDPMVDRWGRVAVARVGFLLSAVGFALAAAVPTAAVSLAAFALAGFGSATIVPAVYAAADAAPGFREGSALTFVGWLMRVGNLATSPLIGVIADGWGLRFGILLPLALGAVAHVYMGRLDCGDAPDAAVAKALETGR